VYEYMYEPMHSRARPPKGRNHLCTYVCVCVYVYVRIYVCVYICMYA
jgi:hypothetical protein